MEVNDKSYWDVNRNREVKNWIPTNIKELELEIKQLKESGSDPSRLQLCESVHERLSKTSQDKS